MKWKSYDKNKNTWEIRNNLTEKVSRTLIQYEQYIRIYYVKNSGFLKQQYYSQRQAQGSLNCYC